MQIQRLSRLTMVLLFLCAPALFALNNRSAVSVNGLDTNPCTPASPCRSFGVAIAATSSGGEIIALDSAGYGPFTVTMPLAVSGAPGAHAALTVASGSGITVNAGATDRVMVRNLVLIGAGGTVGVDDVASKELTVLGCLIRGFGQGIQIETTATNASVQDCAIIENSGSGINQMPGGSTHVVVNNSLLHYNQIGIHVQQAGDFVVTDSTISGNLTAGATVDATTGNCYFTAKRCQIVSNGSYGVQVVSNQNTATAVLSQDVIAFSVFGVANSGTTFTFNNNRIAFNSVNVSGTALVAAPLQ